MRILDTTTQHRYVFIANGVTFRLELAARYRFVQRHTQISMAICLWVRLFLVSRGGRQHAPSKPLYLPRRFDADTSTPRCLRILLDSNTTAEHHPSFPRMLVLYLYFEKIAR